MPPLDPRARYPANSTRIAIPTLSGGVGRQAPTKRARNEAENLDNVLPTLERSAEKRPGTQFIRRYTDRTFNTLDTSVNTSSLELPVDDGSADYFFIWFQVSDDQRYLVVVDYQAADAASLLNVYRIKDFGFFECPVDPVSAEFYEYLTYGNDEFNSDEALSSITIGPQLIILNKKVPAGYTSTLDEGTGTWLTKVLSDGQLIDGPEDVKGRKLTYFTSAPVTPR